MAIRRWCIASLLLMASVPLAAISLGAPTRDRLSLREDEKARSEVKSANYGTADAILKKAIRDCGRSNCSDSVRARLMVDLGALRAGFLDRQADGTALFSEAVKLDRRVEPTPPLASESVRALFATALAEEQARAAQSAMPPGSGSAPVPIATPPVPPRRLTVQATDPTVGPAEDFDGAKLHQGLGVVFLTAAPSRDEAEKSIGKPVDLRSIRYIHPVSFSFDAALGTGKLRPDDGKTAEGELNNFHAMARVMLDYRPIGSQVRPWIDATANLQKSTSQDSDQEMALPNGEKLELEEPVFYSFRGRVGLDYTPVPYFGVGPFVGHRWSTFKMTRCWGDPDHDRCSDETEKLSATDKGAVGGLHLGVATAADPRMTRVLFDFELEHQFSQHVTADYFSASIRLAFGVIASLNIHFRQRIATSGSLGATDNPDAAWKFVHMAPVERFIGGGWGFYL